MHSNPNKCAKFKVNKVPVSLGLHDVFVVGDDLGDEGGVDIGRSQSEKASKERNEQRLEVVQK